MDFALLGIFVHFSAEAAGKRPMNKEKQVDKGCDNQYHIKNQIENLEFCTFQFCESGINYKTCEEVIRHGDIH